MRNKTHPSAIEAEELLEWADKQNPGPWTAHSRAVARAAKGISEKCGMDGEKAYVFGLLHDIGRYEGVRDLHHVIAGHYLLEGKGYSDAARICLTHSFPILELGVYSGSDYDCAEEELDFMRAFLRNAVLDDYDRLIQLCDSICLPDGICLLDVRLMDVAKRYGFNSFTIDKWNAVFTHKEYFDKLCGINIYKLFMDEIIKTSIK